jgi:eukaryotic-like serine/threonine-protein kinase
MQQRASPSPDRENESPPPAERLIPAEWARVKEVFFAAHDLAVHEQPGFLSRACAGDARLRHEVESLLASDAAAGSFCEVPAASLFAPPPDPGERIAPGTILGNCEVLDFISAGGMGDVYRARHLLLEREVALKTVRGAAADEAARRRLLREARHAARLEHPGICRIHEVGITDGLPWIVMPLIRGRSLAEFRGGGRAELPDLLSLGIQIAAALEHAHARGIVHRDLKSSNVLVDDTGAAIILDFGVSRRLPQPSVEATLEASATITGEVAGTLSHMAPEVLFGGEPDPRSDVWSLGVLLYELATGTLPFSGRTAFETSSAILNEPPLPLPATVPLPLRLVIERCLGKEPDRRYGSAGAVGAALEAIRQQKPWSLVARLLFDTRRRAILRTAAAVLVLGAAAAAAPRVTGYRAGAPPTVATLALLPLEFDDANAGVIAAGITHALTAQLGEAAEVRLIAGHSAAAAAAAASPSAAARRLGADAVITGRMRRSGDRIILHATLVAGSSGRVIWSDTFERSISQVLALQSDLVRGVAAAVRLAMRPGAHERLVTVRAVNPEAYEEYLRGRFEWNRRSPESLERAVAHFERAIELDPTWAHSYAALADCYNQFGTVLISRGSPREYRPRAEAAAMRALQIDPHSAEAHAALAYARHYDWRFAEAEEGFRRAIELNPSNALARIWYANLLMSRGRLDEATYQVEFAREIDPFSPVVNTNVGWVLNSAGRHEEAVRHLSGVLELDSAYAQARMRLTDALTALGRIGEAHEQAHRLVALTGDWPPALVLLAVNHAKTAPDSARSTLAQLVERSTHEHVSSNGLATLHDALGDVDGALTWYAAVLAERSNAAVYLRPRDGASGALGDPRLRAMLRDAGLH